MERCSWKGCETALIYSGRGRPPKYCPEHAKAIKQRSDKHFRRAESSELLFGSHAVYHVRLLTG
jgi:hypothetical protein